VIFSRPTPAYFKADAAQKLCMKPASADPGAGGSLGSGADNILAAGVPARGAAWGAAWGASAKARVAQMNLAE